MKEFIWFAQFQIVKDVCLWNLRIVCVARTAIDVVLNFASVEVLVTVGT